MSESVLGEGAPLLDMKLGGSDQPMPVTQTI
jgi:hypothetical protein